MMEELDKQKSVLANQGKLCFSLDLHKFLYGTYQPKNNLNIILKYTNYSSILSFKHHKKYLTVKRVSNTK